MHVRLPWPLRSWTPEPGVDNYKTGAAGLVRSCLKAWNWRLYFFILLFLGLPNAYQVYRTAIIGTTLPDPGSLAIVSQ